MTDSLPENNASNTWGRWAITTAIAITAFVFWSTWGQGRLSTSVAAETTGSPRQIIELDLVEVRLGDHAPTGRGVPIGHVEGKPGDYLPNTRDPMFNGIKVRPRSGPSKVNGHAKYTSRVIYGPSGMAPGISDTCFYTMEHWQTTGVLRFGSPLPPRADGRRLFTHSWIGNGGAPAKVANILRRVDYLIDNDDVLMAVGVNNGAEELIPGLLASSHNAIAVGVSSGDSSGGSTRYEGAGRCKPDIVAPRGRTSFATPVVASVIARLIETADRSSAAPIAARPEVIKAVLLAGATKPDGWKRPSETRPFPQHFGAGVVNYARSHRILSVDPSVPGQILGPVGWAYREGRARSHTRYDFVLDEHVRDLSVTLVWNRRIDGRVIDDLLTGESKWNDTPRVANFNLTLTRVDPQNRDQNVTRSVSRIDNVEHIYLPELAPGRYRFQITRHDGHVEPWDYALAWTMQPTSSDDLNPLVQQAQKK